MLVRRRLPAAVDQESTGGAGAGAGSLVVCREGWAGSQVNGVAGDERMVRVGALSRSDRGIFCVSACEKSLRKAAVRNDRMGGTGCVW